MNFKEIANKFKLRFKLLEEKLSQPDIFSRQKEFLEINQEYQWIKTFIEAYTKKENCLKEIEENKEMATLEDDEEFIKEINQEIENLIEEDKKIEKKLRVLLLPPNKNNTRNIIVEIRPAAGGDEAALFAGDLFRMYSRFMEMRKWKMEILEFSESDLGGLKDVSFSIKGKDVFKYFHLESGVHRVQRIPSTETSGRIHTSTVTCAVLPEVDDVEINIKPEDLRIDVYRASGPGGQCVNTTDSAVRITHLPTGIVSTSQQEKSQHKNKALAMRILKARILTKMQAEEHAKIGAQRKSQVGTGERSERIRTYNYPQNRVTDHRFNITKYDLTNMMEGYVENFINDLVASEADVLLKEEYPEM